MFQSHEKLLRYTLIANGVFSVISGFILVLLSQYIADLFEIAYNFSQTGVSLLLFSGLVFYAGFRSQISPVLVWIIIGMDILWVAGSIILLLLPVSLSTAGTCSVIVVAIFVADFTLFQYKGLKKIILEQKVV